MCIDQSSAAEKSVFGPKMREIYRKAQCVWVYLGKATRWSETELGFLKYESSRYWPELHDESSKDSALSGARRLKYVGKRTKSLAKTFEGRCCSLLPAV